MTPAQVAHIMELVDNLVQVVAQGIPYGPAYVAVEAALRDAPQAERANPFEPWELLTTFGLVLACQAAAWKVYRELHGWPTIIKAMKAYRAAALAGESQG